MDEVEDRDTEENEIKPALIKGIGEIWDSRTVTYYGNNTRSILVSGEINQELANTVGSQLRQLASESDEPISVFINTWGGGLIDSLVIYDTIKSIKPPVITIVVGCCYSGGLVILSAGDLRLATKHSRFFYHQPTLTELEINSSESLASVTQMYKWSQKTMDRVLRTRAKMGRNSWRKMFKNKTEKPFSVKKALEFNFIDDVIEYEDKPKIKIKE
jgi:ATP-dependent Clp protease protease subunit